MNARLPFLAATVSAMLLAIPLSAANQPAAKSNSHAAKSAVRGAWPPETISGKVAMVDPGRKLVVVETQSGIPFDMVLTTRTRIKSGDQSISLTQLTQDQSQSVSVRFIPERRGDFATSIQING